MCDCIEISQRVRKYQVTVKIGSLEEVTIDVLPRNQYNSAPWFRFYPYIGSPYTIWYDQPNTKWVVEEGENPGDTGVIVAEWFSSGPIVQSGSITTGQWVSSTFDTFNTVWFVEENFTSYVNLAGQYDGSSYYTWTLQTVSNRPTEQNEVNFYLYYYTSGGDWVISTILGDINGFLTSKKDSPGDCPPFTSTPSWTTGGSDGYVFFETVTSKLCTTTVISGCTCIKVTYVRKDTTVTITLNSYGVLNDHYYWFIPNDIYLYWYIDRWYIQKGDNILGSIDTLDCPLGQFDLLDDSYFTYLYVGECDSEYKTITYSTVSQGWNSFWSYQPDWMTELNNVFYTMKNGDLWRHNTNSIRNNFYGTQYTSRIKTIFNASPLDNKVFKNLSINSNEAWSAYIDTNLQDAETPYTYFVEKEGFWFAYIRRQDNTISVKAVSTQGVGQVDTATSPSLGVGILTFLINIDTNSISVGDKLYKNISGSLFFLGDIVSYTNNSIEIDTTFGGLPSTGDFLICVKNSQVESYGVRGVYMNVELENDSIDEVELFSLSSTSFKSFQ